MNVPSERHSMSQMDPNTHLCGVPGSGSVVPNRTDPTTTGASLPCAVEVVGNIQIANVQNRLHQDNEVDDEVSIIMLVPQCVTVIDRFDIHPQRNLLQEMVVSRHFCDFQGLHEFMTAKRGLVERRHASTLRGVHERFRSIVQTLVDTRQLRFPGIPRRHPDDDNDDDGTTTVALYATPNVRLRKGNYATFLHSDAVFERRSSNTSTRAMLNVWIRLNDTPPTDYPLCFYPCPVRNTVRDETGKCYATEAAGDDYPVVVRDPAMRWGSFYCFVAGQQAATPSDENAHYLLHGAVHLVEAPFTSSGEPRKSLELRYLV